MADTRRAVLVFSLPDDPDSDYLQLYSASSETGTYTQVGSDIEYGYGTTTYEIDDFDTTLWYKIRFRNSSENTVSPYTEPVYGGDLDNKGEGFLAISSTADGINYASIQDVYDYSGLSPNDIDSSKVSIALKRARAYIDLTVSEMDLSKYTNTFDSNTAKRKWNAMLRIIKEIEICIALGHLFRIIADNIMLDDSDSPKFQSISIGGASISADLGSDGSNATFNYQRISNNYFTYAGGLLRTIRPTTIRIKLED